MRVVGMYRIYFFQIRPDAENHTIRLDTIPERDGMTDGRTDSQKDRRNPSSYYSALHCEYCGCTLIAVNDRWAIKTLGREVKLEVDGLRL